MSNKIKILHFDCTSKERKKVIDFLAGISADYYVAEAASMPEFETQLNKNDFHILIVEPANSGYECIELINIIVKKKPEVPLIVLTAINEVENAVLCLRQGASDYIVKSDASIGRLYEGIITALDRKKNENENLTLPKIIAVSEEKYKRFYENSPIPQQCLDSNGEVIDVNPA